MWKRALISFFLVVLLIQIAMYGANYSTPMPSIYESLQAIMPTIASWSIVSMVLAVSAMLAYRLLVPRGRLLGAVKPRDFVKHILVFGPT